MLTKDVETGRRHRMWKQWQVPHKERQTSVNTIL